MSKCPLILVTRPQPEAGIFAQNLETLGYEIVLLPMLEIAPANFQKPNLADYDAVIFTSANSVRIFSEKVTRRDVPVFTVGAQSAETARQNGFHNVISAQGNGDDLIALIQREMRAQNLSKNESQNDLQNQGQNLTQKGLENVVPMRPQNEGKISNQNSALLFVHGDHVSNSIDAVLREAGYKVHSLEVYASRQVNPPGTEVADLIRQGDLKAVTFFSKRTVESFMSWAEKNGLTTSLSGIKALCLGEGMLECVQPSRWQNVYVTVQPDRDGMLALIQERIPLMNTTDSSSVIPDAEKIIERFGGIRPMASKMEIPVTTVQGWKKRNAIPAARRDDIVAAARIHNVQISDLIGATGPANENAFARVAPNPLAASVPPAGGSTARPLSDMGPDGLEARLAQMTRKAVTRSMMINIALVVISLGAVVALLWPTAKHNEEQLQAVEMQVDEVKQQQNDLRSLIPDNLQERLNTLQAQAQSVQQGVAGVVNQAQTISNDVIGTNAGTVEERLAKLEQHVAEMGGSPKMIEVLERIRSLQQSVGGQQQLGDVISAIGTAITGAQNPDEMTQKLEDARTQNAALGQTFQDIPKEDLKAAALLVGLSQFRESLNRDNQPFQDDLQLLEKLVGEDQPELKASLEKLAPQAEKGVLTPQGLSDQFKGLTGDIVVSSLKGEDVSIQEKAKARMNELLAVEKDGQLITGTDTQATVARAQGFLNQGDVKSAIGQVETLNGPALAAATGWLTQAKMTLLAQQAKQVITQTINMHAFGNAGGITAGGAGIGGTINNVLNPVAPVPAH